MKKFIHGFTLLELCLVLTLAIILTAIAVPSIKDIFTKSKTDIIRYQLLQSIQAARQQASFRNALVSLNWSNDEISLISRHQRIEYFSLPHTSGQLYWQGFPKQNKTVEFSPSGLSHFMNGTFWYCVDHENDPAWAIVLAQSGRARVVYPDSHHVIVNAEGKRIICHASFFIDSSA